MLSSRTFSLAAFALALALFLGSYAVRERLVVRALPLADPNSVVAVTESFPERGARDLPSTDGTLADLRETSVFQSIVGYYQYPAGRSADEDNLKCFMVTEDFGTVFTAQIAAGRWFSPENFQPNANHVAVISFRLARQWQGAGKESEAIGRTVWTKRTPRTVIGVARDGWNAPQFIGTPFADLWAPSDLDAAASSRGGQWLSLAARLRPGMPPAVAAIRSNDALKPRSDLYPRRKAKMRLDVTPYQESLTRGIRQPLLTLYLASGLLVGLAIFSLSIIAILEGLRASQTRGIRLVLGATWWRMVWPEYRRSVLHLIAAAALAWPMSVAIQRLFLQHELTRWLPAKEVLPDARSLPAWGIAVLVALTASSFGLLLSALSGRAGPAALLSRAASARISFPRQSAMAVRLALLAQGILCAAVLITSVQFLSRFTQEIAALQAASLDELWSAHLTLPIPAYLPPNERVRYFDRVRREVESNHGVELGITYGIAGRGIGSVSLDLNQLSTPPREVPQIFESVVDSNFFRVFRARPKAGIIPDAGSFDQGQRRLCVLNGKAASLLGSSVTIGSRIGITGYRGEPFTVAAIISDLIEPGDEGAKPTIYIPFSTIEMVARHINWRSQRGMVNAADVLQTVRAIDPTVRIGTPERLSEVFAPAATLRYARLSIVVLYTTVSVCITVACLLSVLSFAFQVRRKDLAIRSALGATPRRLALSLIGAPAASISLGVLATSGLMLLPSVRAAASNAGLASPETSVVAIAAAAALAVVVLSCLSGALEVREQNTAAALRESRE